ncbi:MAG: hypothetical protein FJ086_03790 [Deltaproteobacteria bacterium]|nr:hypothetical protein [Deltaproteobacteria bacterium]
MEDGTVRCWGDNSAGQLGQGDTVGRGGTPATLGAGLPPVDLGGQPATGLFVRGNTSCTLRADGTLACWGNNSSGLLLRGAPGNAGDGPGEMGASLSPALLGTGRTAAVVALGAGHACALLDDATVKCWGANTSGQLGQGDTTPRGDASANAGNALAPLSLGAGLIPTTLATSLLSSCALFSTGQVKCWGNGGIGELGIEDFKARGNEPGEMGDALPFAELP